MAYLTEKFGDVVVVIPEGMLKGDSETTRVESELRRHLQGGQVKILLDLRKTTHLNSLAIGMIAGVHTSAVNRGARFAVCNIERRIHDTLTVVRLVNVLEVHDTREQALAALATA